MQRLHKLLAVVTAGRHGLIVVCHLSSAQGLQVLPSDASARGPRHLLHSNACCTTAPAASGSSARSRASETIACWLTPALAPCLCREMGWDQGDCWFAHCVKLDEKEMDLFAQRGIGIAHCPYSNLRLASGICPVKKMRDRGVNVGLGVDGSASNDAGHMLAEARLCMLLQRAEGER
jgi:hypothetical protein